MLTNNKSLFAEKANENYAAQNTEKEKDVRSRYRNRRPGLTYDLKVHSVAVRRTDEEGKAEILDARTTENVFTTWCSRQREKPDFESGVATYIGIAKSQIQKMAGTKRISRNLTLEQEKQQLISQLQRTYLGCLPQIPDKFKLDGYMYEIISTTDSYHAISWPIPNKDDTTRTVQVDNIDGVGVYHYYDKQFADEGFRDFCLFVGVKLKVVTDPTDGSKHMALMLGMTEIITYKKAEIISGTANELTNDILDIIEEKEDWLSDLE